MDGPAAVRTKGFFAEGVRDALQLRSEWMEQREDTGLLEYDPNDSDASSEWDNGAEAAVDNLEAPKQVVSLVAMLHSFVDSGELDFRRAKQRFTAAEQAGAREAAESSQGAGEEAPERRLQRLRDEVDALCSWATQQQQEVQSPAPGGFDGSASAAAVEARELEAALRQLPGGGARRNSGGGAGEPAVRLRPAHDFLGPRHLWVCDPRDAHLAATRRLLELGRAQDSRVAPAAGEAPPRGGARSLYRLNAEGGSWMAASEVQGLHDLEQRVRHVRGLLGEEETDSASINDVASQLRLRLEALGRVWDPAAAERLRASVRLLAEDLEVAVAEARRLEALEAEERELDLGGSLEGEEEDDADAPERQVQRLHGHLAGADAVALRVAALDRDLADRAHVFEELGRFADDLASAEARTLQAAELLRSAVQAAETMKVSMAKSREQLERNVAALEAKLLPSAGPPSV